MMHDGSHTESCAEAMSITALRCTQFQRKTQQAAGKAAACCSEVTPDHEVMVEGFEILRSAAAERRIR